MKKTESNHHNPKLARCFLSHKCERSRTTHCKLSAGCSFAKLLESVFFQHAVELLIDPFEPGEHVGERIESLGCDALLFLSTPESVASSWCQLELDVASRRAMPIFVVNLRGDIPEEHSSHIVVDATAPENQLLECGSRFQIELEGLARAMRTRVELCWQISRVSPDNTPAEQREAALIIENTEARIVAKCYSQIGRQLDLEIDETASVSLVRATAKTRTQKAAEMLSRRKEHELHPYVKYEIEQALSSMLADVIEKSKLT